MKEMILKTQEGIVPLVLRVTLVIVVFPHGAQKLFGWFGGYGFSGTMGFFTETAGLPWIIGFLVIMLETIGAVALMAGFATRIISACYIALALGIVFSTHIQNGFFMNWFGNQAGEGYEYFILWTGIATVLVITGGGRLSLDKMMWKNHALQLK